MDERDEARALKCRTRVLDATKQNISCLEKEMTKISKKLEIVFADAATDQVKNFVEELGRRLQSQAVLGEKGQMKDRVKEIQAQPKHVLRRDPNASSSNPSSLASFRDIHKMALRMRDRNAQSSIASPSQAHVQAILSKYEESRNDSATASSSKAVIKKSSSTASSSKATIKNSRDGSSTASSSKATLNKSRDGSSTASSSKASSKKTQKLNKHLWSKDVKCSNCAAHMCQAKNGNKAPK